MSTGGFPGAGLIMQLFRQMTKPTSQRIVAYAARHPIFRKYMLILPGRSYYYFEESLRTLKEPRVVQDKHKPQPIRKIKDQEAIEIGSQLMIEVVLFGLLSLLVISEYIRSQIKNEKKEMRQKAEMQELVDLKEEAVEKLRAIELEVEELRKQLRELEADK